MTNEKPKKYYSLNLTEGRIFIIFISIIMLMVIIIFGSVILISRNTKINEMDLTLEDSETSIIESNDLNFYTDLSEESEITPFIHNSENNSIIASLDNNANDQNDFKIELNEEKGSTKNAIEGNKNSVNDIVKIDNSEVLYSSAHNNKPEEINVAQNNEKKEVTKKEVVVKKEIVVAQVNKKRYVVQVGSYADKKTAEDISLYYQIQGYPVYVKAKDSEGKTYYRLRVGPFKEKNRAEKYLTSLKESKYGKSCYISVVYL